MIHSAFFGLLTYGIWAALNGGRVSGAKLLNPLWHLLWYNSAGLVISGEFWFLSAMFFASLCFDGLFRICREAVCFVLIMAIIYGFNRVVMKTALRVSLGRRSLKSETGKPPQPSGISSMPPC